MYRVFLSHSHADAEHGRLIKAEVEATGRATIYLAEEDIALGRPLAAKVQKAIRQSDAVVVLLTRSSETSAWVNQEIGYALRDKPVFPLVESGVEIRGFAMLAGLEYASFHPESPGEALNHLSAFIERKAAEKDVQQLVAILVLVAVLVVISYGSEQRGT